MKRSPGICLLLFLLTIILSCSSTAKKKPAAADPPVQLQPGKFYESIASLSDPSVTYALYIPSDYTHSKKFPVVVLFDPHAKGTIPVKRFQDLAEKYRFILIGSNNSENGQPTEETSRIVSALWNELENRYSVDQRMIYTSGFSGGSRIASMLAMFMGGIRGVIACGAGLPTTDKPSSNHFDYFGIVGNADFNMWEMRDLEKNLRSSLPGRQAGGIRHALLIFNGIHGWPDAEVYEKAIQWQLLNAMDDTIIPSDPKVRMDFSEGWTRLERKGIIIKPSLEDEKIHDKELALQNKFAEAFYSKDIGWWQRQIRQLKSIKGVPPGDTLMNHRLASYIGLLCYSVSHRALAARNSELLENTIKVYELIEPQNTEIPKLKEQLKTLR